MLAAADFFFEVWTIVGLLRYHVFYVIQLASRKVHIAGIIPEPHGSWMKQMPRNLSDGLDGFLMGYRYLLHDRASLFGEDFRMILQASGIESVRLPARSPNLNAFAERFVRTFIIRQLAQNRRSRRGTQQCHHRLQLRIRHAKVNRIAGSATEHFEVVGDFAGLPARLQARREHARATTSARPLDWIGGDRVVAELDRRASALESQTDRARTVRVLAMAR